MNANYLETLEEKDSETDDRNKEEQRTSSPSTVDCSEEFAVGQIVWVWLSGHPLWPGMIAESPEHDNTPGEYYRCTGVTKR